MVAAAAIPLALASPGRAASPELRGTWLTTTSSDDLSAANIATAMASLRQVGLNTVYVEAWKNGYTNFNSPTLQTFIGSSSLNPSLGGRILLSESRTAAANAGLVHGAWFEYGLMAEFIGNGGFPSNPLAIKAETNGWLLQDSAGNYSNSSNSFAWMNPLVPEVRNLIKGIVVDAVQQFDLQIVQFDDHLAWPVQFGYDTYTRNAYKAETNRNLPTSFSDSRFVAWRQEKMQAFVTELVTAVRAAKPSVIVSLAPSVASFSAANYCTDWPDYVAAGLVDEVVPQVYRSTYSSFATEWVNQQTAVGTAAVPDMAAGLRLLGTGAATPWADLEQMIVDARGDGSLGHSIWYSEGVSNAGTFVPGANYRTQLTSFYNVAGTGPAANPHFTTVRWAGSGGTGGSGTWSNLDATWKDRSTIWVRDARGIFDGVGGTVTVSGTVLAGGGLQFASNGYTVSGGTLQLSGFDRPTNTVEVASAVTATLASRLTGTTGLRKTGAGTLVLSGTNTSLAGGIDVAAGTLRLTAAQAAAGGAVTVAAGARLAVDPGVAMQATSLTLTGGTLDASTLTVASSGGIGSLAVQSSASITGSPALTVGSGGSVSLPTDRRLTVGLTSLAVSETATGRLDLGAGQVTILPGGTTAAALRADIIAGRNGGAWNGAGGIRSAAAAASSGTRAVGYVVAANGSATASFAAPGDTNLDGMVDLIDLLEILGSGTYDSGLSSVWSQGDFNYDGKSDLLDLLDILGSNTYDLGSYFPVAPAGGMVAVPEPGSLGLLASLLAAGPIICRLRRLSSP